MHDGAEEAVRVDTEPSNAPIRVGVMGLRYWGPLRVRGLHDLPEFDLVCGMDLDGTAANVLPRGVEFVTDVDALFHDDRVEAIVISTPIPTLFTLAKQALDAGKHVFVESPFLTARDLVDLIKRAKDVKRTLMVGQPWLYTAAVREVRRLIAAGEVGDILAVSTTMTSLGPYQSNADLLVEPAAKAMSVIRYLLGTAPDTIMALARSTVMPNIVDLAFIQFEYDSGAIGSVELSWRNARRQSSSTVVGSKKMVIHDELGEDPVRIFDSGVEVISGPGGRTDFDYRRGGILVPPIREQDPVKAELQEFAFAVRDHVEPAVPVGLHLDVLETVDAIRRSVERRAPERVAPARPGVEGAAVKGRRKSA
jgi:predicted dehydrogenase